VAPTASTCSHCRAPLPAATGVVECPYCGAATVVEAPVGTKQIRAVVRRVLAEERAPVQSSRAVAQRSSRLWGLAIAGAVVFFVAVLVSIFMQRSQRAARPVALPVVTPPRLPQLRQPVAPGPRGLGRPDLLALGDDSALYLVTDGQLVKADRRTHRPVWRARTLRGYGRGGDGTVVPLAGRVAFAGPMGVAFFDDETGAATGQYLFRHGGHKVSACAAGAHQVLVKTTFDGTLRFDVRTGARVEGGPACDTHSDMHCDPGQRCAWDTRVLPGGLSCRHALYLEGHLVTFCQAEGTLEQLVVDVAGGKVRWKTPGGSSNPGYASVVGSVLVVAADHLVEGFELATGQKRWSSALAGDEGAVVSDGRLLYFGQGDTVVELDAATGVVVDRFLEADAPPSPKVSK
jgi:uncharacterized Zn finger protein (UPF0148 family)